MNTLDLAIGPLVTSAILLGASAAAAQTPSTSSGQSNTVLGEIIVTAQKRNESLQSVPVTVTAVSSQLLKAVNAPSIQDLNLIVPGLDIQAQGSYTLPSLRGVSTTLTTLGNEPNVAIYVDGVYYPVSFANFMRFSDTDHVEVLKGPQGTLFGHNATGGAINIITRTPSSTPTGDFSAGYGSYNDFELNGYASAALTDSLTANIAAYGHRDSGWAYNIVTHSHDTATNGYGVRAKFVFQPLQTVKATLTLDDSMEENPPANFNVGGDSALSGFGAIVASKIGQTSSNFNITNPIYQYGGALTVESNFKDFDLISVTGGRWAHAHGHFDIDNTSIPAVELYYGPRSVSESEDLRLQSHSPNTTLTWVVGVNAYVDDDTFDPFNVVILGPQNGETKTTSGGLYGQATYRFVTRASLTLGGRFSDEQLTETFSSQAQKIPFTKVTKNWIDFSPKATLDYDFTRTTKGYLTVAKGFKGGAFNVGSYQTSPIQPETLWDYEVGLKSDIGRHLRINVAGFYYDYSNLQVQAFGKNAVTPIDTNAPKAQLYGLDADITARYGDLLTTGDTLSVIAGVSVLHSAYTSYPGAQLAVENPGGGDAILAASANGKELVEAPTFTLNFVPSYAFGTAYGRFTLTPTIYYNNGYFLDAVNSQRFRQSAFTRVNTTVNWDSPDGRYYISVWGRNITGVKQLGGVLVSGLGPVGNGYPPAWYGVTVGYHF